MEDENENTSQIQDEEMEADSNWTDEEESAENDENKVYLPGDPLQEGEELTVDESAYIMYHQAQTGSPCLSFDVLQNRIGDSGEDYPLTCYVVAGTQAERGQENQIVVIKMSNLTKSEPKNEDHSEDESSDSDSEVLDNLPELETAAVKHRGAVNRLRVTEVGDKVLTASWSENGKVYIWDLSRPFQAVDDADTMATYTRNQESPKPLFKFTGHQVEGYAVDWSKMITGQLATGDCNKNIHVWKPQEGGTWHVDQRPFSGHTSSVEDIQWSPNEANVFASCSVDKSIRIWDARVPPNKACMLTAQEAHIRDVNVIHWNAKEPFIVSGGDDGVIKIWDLRQFEKNTPAAVFKHHSAPISSVEWNPADCSVFAASGADDQLTIWDLSVERDTNSTEEEPDVPPQLLFIHQGQNDIKELHWHSRFPGVIISTALSGFNIFKTISV